MRQCLPRELDSLPRTWNAAKWDASHRMCLSEKREGLSGELAEVKPALAGVPGELMGTR